MFFLKESPFLAINKPGRAAFSNEYYRCLQLFGAVVEGYTVVLVGAYALVSLCRSGCGWHDNAITWLPAFRRCYSVLVTGLQGIQQAQEFRNRTAVAHGVVHHRPQHAFRVDHEGCTDRRCVCSTRVNHAISAGNIHFKVGDDREGYLDAKLLLDVTHPRNV